MKFPYVKLRHKDPHQKYILAPWIPINFQAHDENYEIFALVDSGADFCIFDKGVAQFLHINIESGKLLKTGGLSGNSDVYYFDNIWMTVGGHQIKVIAGFVPGNLADGSISGILGRQGFFEYFKVTIDEKNKVIELKLHT